MFDGHVCHKLYIVHTLRHYYVQYILHEIYISIIDQFLLFTSLRQLSLAVQ